jgi:hypothetical protein
LRPSGVTVRTGDRRSETGLKPPVLITEPATGGLKPPVHDHKLEGTIMKLPALSMGRRGLGRTLTWRFRGTVRAAECDDSLVMCRQKGYDKCVECCKAKRAACDADDDCKFKKEQCPYEDNNDV